MVVFVDWIEFDFSSEVSYIILIVVNFSIICYYCNSNDNKFNLFSMIEG